MVRAKFKVESITHYQSSNEVRLSPVYGDGSPENKAFFAATPSGEIRLSLIIPDVAAQFKVGSFHYVDFTPAE